jgi:putative ATP-binding cassette transporter
VRLLDFVKKESTEPWTSPLTLGTICGIANGVLLALITTGASAAQANQASFRLMAMFIATIGVFILSKKYSLNKSVALIERMIKSLRSRICDKLRRSELLFVEGLGRGDLYTKISQDANLISQTAFVIVNSFQSAVMVVFAMMYIAWLSMTAFIIIVIAVTIGVAFAFSHWRFRRTEMSKLSGHDAEFLDALGHIIDGFKEAKLNRKRNHALFARFEEVSETSLELKIRLGAMYIADIMYSHVFFLILVGVIVFLLPRLMPTYSEMVLQMTAAVLFIVGPLEMVVGTAPLVGRANVALENLYSLEQRLDENLRNQAPFDPAQVQALSGFQRIELDDVLFRYPESPEHSRFTLGPINLSVARGETVFIVGGNGSGKSTLLKLMTGLYEPESGAIRVDSATVDRKGVAAYRELFSAIFSDFHLFDRLYGLEHVSDEQVLQLIREMQLESKTGYVDGRFTNIQLSTGQRKRLAMITALLEDREVYVLDEWAADQDTHFRDYYYSSILKRLKEGGKTVIAVTHDDRYWKIADRVVKLELGKVAETTEQS